MSFSGIIIFNHKSEIIHLEFISASGNNCGVELVEGTFHTAVALSADTVVLEVKEGPYDSNTDKEFMQNFPLEGTVEASILVQTWQSYFKPFMS